MITQLAPRHTPDHDPETCACCRHDAPAWSRRVVVTAADGTQRRLSVSKAVALLIDQLLTVVLSLMAWVEQGLGVAELKMGTPAGTVVTSSSGNDSQPHLPPHTLWEEVQIRHHPMFAVILWKNLAEPLDKAIKMQLHPALNSCFDLAVQMQAACLNTLSGSPVFTPVSCPTASDGGIPYRALDVKVGGTHSTNSHESLLSLSISVQHMHHARITGSWTLPKLVVVGSKVHSVYVYTLLHTCHGLLWSHSEPLCLSGP